MSRPLRPLSSQIFAATVVILLVTTALGFALVAGTERARIDRDFEQRAATIALAMASFPEVGSCLATPASECAHQLQSLAEDERARTGAAYIVVINMSGVRLTHPDPKLVGQKVSEPMVIRDGRVHTGTDQGATGRSANGKAPVYDGSGRLVGEVSAGIREQSVSDALWQVLPSYAGWLLCALSAGALASWQLARVLKRRTFGLELEQISALLLEREATLHCIREGVIAFDASERVTVVNDEAARLLGLAPDVQGRRLGEVLPPGPVLAALTATRSTPDQLVYTDEQCLVTNRMPVVLDGRRRGSVVTLRDQTELMGLADQLSGQRSLTESMRAQQHEFANSMHVVAGLLELGDTAGALDYLLEVRGTAAEFDLTLREQVRSPHLVGLLLGKAAEFTEHGAELIIDPRTSMGSSPPFPRALVTIVGNLLDNALDAVGRAPAPRRVTLFLLEDGDATTIEVGDTGPGIASGDLERIFTRGWTSKPGPGGTGLALVRSTVHRLGGTIEVEPDRPGHLSGHPSGHEAGHRAGAGRVHGRPHPGFDAAATDELAPVRELGAGEPAWRAGRGALFRVRIPHPQPDPHRAAGPTAPTVAVTTRSRREEGRSA